jgi:hypothetical protein
VSEYVTQNLTIIDIECVAGLLARLRDNSETVALGDPVMPVANGLCGLLVSADWD